MKILEVSKGSKNPFKAIDNDVYYVNTKARTTKDEYLPGPSDVNQTEQSSSMDPHSSSISPDAECSSVIQDKVVSIFLIIHAAWCIYASNLCTIYKWCVVAKLKWLNGWGCMHEHCILFVYRFVSVWHKM